MTIFDILSLIGGLAMFLFGMNIMGQALEKSAGSSLKTILSRLTDSPIKGLVLGCAVTAVIQSSSATTVMVVGFVNSGIMQLKQAIGIIMGANIGTTVTAWILSLTGIDSGNVFVKLLKPTSFTPVLALIGILLYSAAKSDKKKDIGTVLLGFAVLMFGMDAMSDAVKPLRSVPEFTNILLLFSNPFFGVIAGAVLTGIIQSSSASVGILQALSATGAVTFGSAIPIIMGQNIGTCVTALISSVGANKNARRAALVHFYFNLIGTVVCLAVFYIADAIIGFEFLAQAIDQKYIAVVHTAFNICCTALLLPFSRQLEALAIRTIPDKTGDKGIVLLDERLFSTPAVAVEQCRKVAIDMARKVHEHLLLSVALLAAYSEKDFSLAAKMEDEIDHYEDELGTYLVKLSMQPLGDDDKREVAKLLRSITDFERISDHAYNIAENAKEKFEKAIAFSESAQEELRIITDALNEIIGLAIKAFESEDIETARRVEPLEEVIDELNVLVKTGHVKRLQEGGCTIEQGFVFNDLLTNFERVSDHCSNIAACQIEMAHSAFDTHAYLSTLKTGENREFIEAYKHYRNKYALS